MIADNTRPDTPSNKRRAAADMTTQVAAFAKAAAAYKGEILNRYKGADRTRFTRDMRGTNSQGTSADYHYNHEGDFYFLQEIARDIDRNDAVAGQAIDRLCVNVLQNGFKYDPQTGSDGIDRYLRERWEEWANDPKQADIQQERTFDQIAHLAFRQSLIDGDHFLLPLNNGQLQSIEAHRIRTPHGQLDGDRNLAVHGVQLDQNRRRTQYYVLEDSVGLHRSTVVGGPKATIPAFNQFGDANIFQVYNPKRTSQTRGVTIFAPIIMQVGILDDIQFAKLVQQQGVSVWIAAIERQFGAQYGDEEAVSDHYMDDVCRVGEMKPLEDLSAGMFFRGHPGESLKGFSPDVPNPTYLDHAKQVMELIGVNLGLPYIVLMMDASKTNFSGWRGAMEQAKMLWRCLQSGAAQMIHRNSNRFKVRQWTTPGTEHTDPFLVRSLSRGFDVFRHGWGFPAWPYVQPVEDVTANILEVTKAQNSPRRIQAKQGRDYEQVIVGELLDDNFALISRAMQMCDQLKQQYPDQTLTWERLVSVSVPDNVNLNTSQMIDDESNDTQALDDLSTE